MMRRWDIAKIIGEVLFWLLAAVGFGMIAGIFVYYVWAAYFARIPAL